MQKYDGVKFRKDRVKIQIWGKPAIFFSWAMSVHNEILLDSSRPFLCALVVCNQRTLNHISTSQLREPTIMLLFLLIHILGLYTFAQGQGERCFDLIDKRSLFVFLESSCEARLPHKSRESLTSQDVLRV